jgi:hypothetical protein
MRSLRNIALTACFLAAPAVFAQVAVSPAPAQDWRFAHPGATLVGSIHVKAVLDSPLVNTLITQATAKNPSAEPTVRMVRQVLGGVSEVRFSVLDMGKGKNPDVLALVTGVLDDATVGALMQGKAQGKAGVRRIDANTILVGEGQSLEDAVARMSKPAVGLQARALDRSKALANNDLWISGTLPDLPMTVPLLESLRSVALGISAQSDLRIELALETASPKTAEDLVSSARKSQVQQPGLGAALQSEVDGSTARFRFAMPADQVIQAVQQAIANSGGQPSLPAFLGQSQAAPEPAAPPKPKRDSIIIYGLDGGPREIKPSDAPEPQAVPKP